MDDNYIRDRLEMYSRRRSSNRDIALNGRDSGGNRRNSNLIPNISNQQSSFSFDDNNSTITPIPTISGGGTQASLGVVTRTPSNVSKSKDKRKRSTTGSDLTDKSDSSKKTNRRRLSNALTSSFLRKKRIEYAGIR